MTKTSNLNLITKKICELFEYTIPGEWGIEGDPENDIPVLRSTNFTNEGRIDYSNLAFRKIDPKRLALRLVNKGTILIEKSGGSPSQPAGRVVYCDEDFNGSASNFIEIAKTNNLFCPKYVFFLLHHLYQIGLLLKYQQQTTGIINFKLEQYKNEEVLLPRDRKEQTQIAAILSTIDRAIEQTEAIIAKQQRIKTGLMQDLLTKGIDEDGNVRSDATHKFKDSPLGQIPTAWEAKTIGGILNEYGGKLQTGPFGSQLHASEYVAEGIPFVMPQDIQNSGISEVNIARITEERANDLARHRMLPGDIVFARRGDLSRCAVVKEYQKGWVCGSGCFLMKPPKESISPRWITEVYRYYTTQLQVNVQAVGSTMVNLNKGILASLYIPFPTHREQVQIEERLNDMEKDQIKLWQQLDKLKCSKIGLMQDLLTGNVRVTALLND